MNITLVCRYPHRARTAEQVWDDLSILILNLSSADPLFRQWWANPRSARDPYVPLSDSRAFVARVEEDDRRWAREFPGQPSDGSNGIMITNSGNDSDWTKRGGAGLSYQPNLGVLRFHVDRIEKAYRSPGNVVGTMLSAVLRTLPISFAQTNVQQRVDGQLLLYSRDRAPFPHREFLGWMGYVDTPLTEHQIPAAARLERCGNGTLILATDVLDLSDPHAVQQANQVEMSLVDLGLLPVIDPALK
ncbi:Immunity protein 52 [Stenotrophomonas maltophilia]|nr:Immunity protein 52 [Stenotrophomonas maltophilia]